MDFKYIDELGLDLTIDLKVLQRNSQRYDILLYQHEGSLYADENKISNHHPVDNRFEKFFEKAKIEDTDIALTPEYSCPFNVVKSIINDSDKWPNNQKLWIAGCESLSLNELETFKNDYESDERIVFYDQRIHNENKRFVDPVVYIFKAEKEGNQKLVILIQFKTHHMGVWGNGVIERDNLIEGKEIYVIRNHPTNSINLMTLICSEALNFRDMLTDANKDYLDWEDKPYLIFQPQLNPKPTDHGFVDFRKFVLQSKDKEIISLNWQVDTLIGGVKIEHSSSRSGLYLKSDEINLDDRSRIVNNHKLGLYYFCNKKNRHSYILSSKPHIFLIENLPVKISGVQQVQTRRDGPEIKKAFEYSNPSNEFRLIQEVDDLHLKYLDEIKCNNQFLSNPETCIIEKERLVCLSAGNVDNHAGNHWWKVQNIYSIYMNEDNEINRRLTVARNESDDSMNIKNRFVESVNELKKIIDSKNDFPSSLGTLKNEDLIISYCNDSKNDNYRYNIASPNGEYKIATLAYLGTVLESQANKTYSALTDLFNRDEIGKERVVVFYKSGNNIFTKSKTNFANVINPNDFSNTSIFKSEEL